MSTPPPAAQGLHGLQGLQGLQGLAAAHGLQGLHGFAAAQGLQGLAAAHGLQGLQGFAAAQGLHGLAAARRGTTHSVAPAPPAAAQGLQGLHGLHGFAAAHGLQGLAAAHGLAATHGLQGLHGLQAMVRTPSGSASGLTASGRIAGAAGAALAERTTHRPRPRPDAATPKPMTTGSTVVDRSCRFSCRQEVFRSAVVVIRLPLLF